MNPDFTIYYMAAFGGGLIGAASGLFYLLRGRISGISGIFFEALNKQSIWRYAFIFGLIISGIIYSKTPFFTPFEIDLNWWELAIGGLFVGVGTRLANGCTSGHGICGISRLSARSIVAVITFMGAAVITVYIRLHWLV